MPAPTITPLPTPPSRSTDPTNFAIEADAFVAALPEFANDANAQATYLDNLAATVDADAASAAADADIASAAATSALAAADVGLWVSGTTYAIGDNVISPISFQTYRRKTSGAGTTDPSLDATNWALLTFYPTSPLQVIGDAGAGSQIRLPEDTDNGSNYVALKAPDALASNLTLTLPTADGTSGQFLSTNGSGALAFASVTPSAYELIATAVASNTTNVDFTNLNSNYSEYVIVCSGFYTTDVNTLWFLTSSNNGSTFDSASGNYIGTAINAQAATLTSAAMSTSFPIIMTGVTVDYGHYMTIRMVNAGIAKNFAFEATAGNYISDGVQRRLVGFRKSTTAVNAVRLSSGTSNLNGTFRLYGVKAA